MAVLVLPCFNFDKSWLWPAAKDFQRITFVKNLNFCLEFWMHELLSRNNKSVAKQPKESVHLGAVWVVVFTTETTASTTFPSACTRLIYGIPYLSSWSARIDPSSGIQMDEYRTTEDKRKSVFTVRPHHRLPANASIFLPSWFLFSLFLSKPTSVITVFIVFLISLPFGKKNNFFFTLIFYYRSFV